MAWKPPKYEPSDHPCSSANIGSEYTDEEREFLTAMERMKRERNNPHPTWGDVLAILVALGYRKEADAREFEQAMSRYCRLRKRPFPKCSEALAVAKSLGWSKG